MTGVGTNFPWGLLLVLNQYIDDDTSKLFTQLESVLFRGIIRGPTSNKFVSIGEIY